VEGFITELARQNGLLIDFDERLWFSLVDFAMVCGEGEVRFAFKNGIEITV
jgi:hypothetical protein